MATPCAQGYRWPAEWEPQDACWLGWPDVVSWFREDARHAKAACVELATAISEFVPVNVLANPSEVEVARSMLPEQVKVHEVPIETPYVRDTCPLFVAREREDGCAEIAAVDFQFNVYGAKKGPDGKWYQKYGAFYADELQDALVGRRVAALADQGLPRFESRMILEGGSIHSDGQGTLITTEECLLHPNRRGEDGFPKQQVEAELAAMLGITKVIWLPQGLFADHHTNGHVDNFCCFLAPGRVLLAWADDVTDPQHEISMRALAVLETTPDARGRRLEVIKVPTPPPLFITKEEEAGMQGEPKKRRAGDRLPASYINFYRGNGGAVIPAFGVPTDALARETIQQAFGPAVKVVSVPAREIVLGGGDFHCLSMQQAAAGARRKCPEGGT